MVFLGPQTCSLGHFFFLEDSLLVTTANIFLFMPVQVIGKNIFIVYAIVT